MVAVIGLFLVIGFLAISGRRPKSDDANLLWWVQFDEPIVDIAASHDGSRVGVVGSMGKAICLDTNSGNVLESNTDADFSERRRIAFGTENATIVRRSGRQNVKGWNYETSQVKFEIRASFNDLHEITAVSMSPNGRYVAVGTSSPDPRLVCLDTKTKQVRYSRPLASISDTAPSSWAHISDIKYSHDGKTITLVSASGIFFCDSETGLSLRSIRIPSAIVRASLSGDEKFLVCATIDCRVFVFDAQQGVVVFENSAAGESQFPQVAMSPNSDYVLLASSNHLHSRGVIKIWQRNSGKLVGTIESCGHCISGLVVLPDGVTVAISTFGGSVELWDVTKFLRHVS